MFDEIIAEILQSMLDSLNNAQLILLKEVLVEKLQDKFKDSIKNSPQENSHFVSLFVAAKRVEGCSPRTLTYYEDSLRKIFQEINKDIMRITTDDIRIFLDRYYDRGTASKLTIDNMRRILSSFFNWLEEENHIIKSPMRRIHKIRVGKKVKETYTDEMMEKLRDCSTNIRDLAIIDLLATSGIRVGELVNLNKSNVNFDARECIVYGKGDKERRVYFDVCIREL